MKEILNKQENERRGRGRPSLDYERARIHVSVPREIEAEVKKAVLLIVEKHKAKFKS
jgi:hypothetical protein